MWKVRKPDLDKALSDVDKLVNLNVVPKNETSAIKDLIRNYDIQSGMVTDAQLKTISDATSGKLYKAYKDDGMYNEKGDFHDIRLELYNSVSRCPYCSTGTGQDTLDHFMHKKKYKAMSMCRLNLIPSCWRCNGEKGTKPYGAFVHPYYVQFPVGTPFFYAEISVINDNVVFRLNADSAVLPLDLYQAVTNQIKNLKLDERLQKSGVEFLRNRIPFSPVTDVQTIKATLQIQLEEIQREFGLNDWRTALLRGLSAAINQPNSQAILKAIRETSILKRDEGA